MLGLSAQPLRISFFSVSLRRPVYSPSALPAAHVISALLAPVDSSAMPFRTLANFLFAPGPGSQLSLPFSRATSRLQCTDL